MIVDVPNSYNVTIGQPLRTPDAQDTKVYIPNAIVPVVLSLIPHDKNDNSGVPCINSFLLESLQQKNNTAGGTGIFATLQQGLWELEMTIAHFFDFNSTPGTLRTYGMSVFNLDGPYNRPVLVRTPNNTGSVDYNRMRILSRNIWQLRSTWDALAVGEHWDAKIIVNAIRIV